MRFSAFRAVKPMKRNEDLADCASCGGEPSVGSTRSFKRELILIECTNRDCREAPVAVGATYVEARRFWNSSQMMTLALKQRGAGNGEGR